MPRDRALIRRPHAGQGLQQRRLAGSAGARDHEHRAGRDGQRDGTIDDYLRQLGLPSGGAVRVSLGLSSSPGDVDTFLGFIAETYRDRPRPSATVRDRTTV